MSNYESLPVRAEPLRGLLLCGGWAALGSVALTVVQVVIFSIWPPVQTVFEIYALMNRNPVLGLVSLDVLLLVNNIAVWLFYLGLGAALWGVSRSGVILAVGLGTLQMAAYVASNPAVEMLALTGSHQRASPEGQLALEAAGQGVLAAWKGTAFLTYYFLGAAVLFVLAWLLWRSTRFSRATGWWALIAAVLMLVPSPFGMAGMVFSLASLVPWCVFCVVAGHRLLRAASAAG